MSESGPERYKAGQRVRIRSGTFDGKYGDVLIDNGHTVVVAITDHGTFDLLREHIVAAMPITAADFIRDDEVGRRLGQLEYRLLTAQAELPGMIRELREIRQRLEE